MYVKCGFIVNIFFSVCVCVCVNARVCYLKSGLHLNTSNEHCCLRGLLHFIAPNLFNLVLEGIYLLLLLLLLLLLNTGFSL